MSCVRCSGYCGPTATPRRWCPRPGLARLEELAAHARTAGIAVRLVTEGAPRPVPAGVDVGRVPHRPGGADQHASATPADTRPPSACATTPDALTIEVDDDGPAAVRPARPGNGVAGMTERARALGGTLDAGPRPGGGFRVLARLPA